MGEKSFTILWAKYLFILTVNGIVNSKPHPPARIIMQPVLEPVLPNFLKISFPHHKPNKLMIYYNFSVSFFSNFLSGIQIRLGDRKYFFLFINQNMLCYGYPKEPFQRDSSFENPKHMTKLSGEKVFAILHAKNVYLNL